jgi:hypothetical protein
MSGRYTLILDSEGVAVAMVCAIVGGLPTQY